MPPNETSPTDPTLPGIVDEQALDTAQDCSYTTTTSRHDLNPRTHKTKYRVAVEAFHGFEAAKTEYEKIFTDYLTATAGQRFNPPIEFEMFPVTFQGLFHAIGDEDSQQEVDFVFSNPGSYSCLGVEFGATALATVISHVYARGHVFDLDQYGGVMFSLAGRKDINNIADLRDKIIGAGGINMIAGGQLQFYEMEEAGLSYIMDPLQVALTGDQDAVVQGVMDGNFDVGFVRTDEIERFLDSSGNPIDPDIFKGKLHPCHLASLDATTRTCVCVCVFWSQKRFADTTTTSFALLFLLCAHAVIESRSHVLPDGHMFPFMHSTEIVPVSTTSVSTKPSSKSLFLTVLTFYPALNRNGQSQHWPAYHRMSC